MPAKTHERKRARELRQQGCPIKQIAKELGVSPGSVHLWCNDIKLTKQQQEKIKEARRPKHECRWCGRTIGSFVKVNGKKIPVRRKSECLVCRPYQPRVARPKKTKKPNGQRVIDSRRRMKRRAVDYKGGKCRVCSYNRCVTSMHFHHLDPDEKDFQISSGDYRGWVRVKAELDKCVLLCNRCHGEVHEGITDLTPHLTPEEIELAYTHTESEEDDLSILDFFDIPG